jgi:V8-like Glu-specific endopeptidase
MYKQGNSITDVVVPILFAEFNVNKDNKREYRYKEQLATGFFIGERGYILTAGHVIDQINEKESASKEIVSVIGFKKPGGGWYSYKILEKEKHPSEDVGILKIEGNNWQPLAKINPTEQQSGIEYFCWGYPRAVTEELREITKGGLDNPTIIFSQGHVRRKIFNELRFRMFIGKNFYELSETVGGGNSGAPMILKTAPLGKEDSKWEIIGIYIGEKNENIGYSVRSDAFFNWQPAILKRTILEEANN